MPLWPGFFESLMIRATPCFALNDPFEGSFNKYQVRDAHRKQIEFYQKNEKKVPCEDSYDVDEAVSGIQSEFRDLGVISFTEDYNNPIMWAHYADQHQGVVIEFDFKEPFFADSIYDIDGRKSRFGKSYLANFFEFPEKVNYRRTMPSFDRSEFSAPDSMDQYHSEKFNRTILFTKGNDWIYEKEHRSIVQLKYADAIICDDNKKIREILNQESCVTLSDIGDGKIKITYPPEYEMHEEMGDQSIKQEINNLLLSSGSTPIHMFRVNPKSISGIYFGCKSNEFEHLEIIKKNQRLQHLENIYKMSVSEDHYQLCPRNIWENQG